MWVLLFATGAIVEFDREVKFRSEIEVFGEEEEDEEGLELLKSWLFDIEPAESSNDFCRFKLDWLDNEDVKYSSVGWVILGVVDFAAEEGVDD